MNETKKINSPGQDRPELQAVVQAWVDAGFAGMTMRVNDEHGEWVGSAGVRELGGTEKPPVDGSFWGGSIIKNFTATLLLQLVGEGKLGLDAPVADYLPEWELDRRITARMLLQHTSGLFNYTGEYYEDGTIVAGIPATGKDWIDNRFHSYRPEELIELALSKPARFEPGADWSYSNTNYTLALLLIEQVTGNSYQEELERRILQPLGMRDTMAAGTVDGGTLADLPEPHAHGYYRYQDGDEWKVEDVTRQNLSLLSGAGDMLSTSADLHTYITALLGGKLLPAELLAEMQKPHPKLGYGLGLFIQDLGPDGPVVVHHNGSPPGGYGGMMVSTLDGSKTVTGYITMSDKEMNPAEAYQKSLALLFEKVFSG